MEKGKYRIGIDIGGTNIKFGVINDKNEILFKTSIKSEMEAGFPKVVRNIANALHNLLYVNGIPLSDCRSIGIGCPGTVDFIHGKILFANNLYWEDVPLADELRKYVDLPVKLSNDANCAALGEFVAGGAGGIRNMVMITLGTGVGGGIILDGKLYESGAPGGTEMGHMVLVVNGELCTCGRRGCFEAYASATALIRETRKAAESHPDSLIHKLTGGDLDKISGLTPFEAAKAGDPVAKKVVEDYIMYLGEGLIDIINVFRPDKILLSGGVSNQGEALIKPLREYVKRFTYAGNKIKIAEIEQAKLGNDAGIIGAANL
ncbi:MAG: ROK family protein [Fusobacteriaceae bacterium]|nr:ROK family protein [Fusobacteriaceae bacterium]